jgi:hypothetical protein
VERILGMSVFLQTLSAISALVRVMDVSSFLVVSDQGPIILFLKGKDKGGLE